MRSPASPPSEYRPREMAFNRRMSDQEALMWNIEKDPWMNPSGAVLTLLDRPGDYDLMLAGHRAHREAGAPPSSQNGSLDMGLLADPVAVTDPAGLAQHPQFSLTGWALSRMRDPLPPVVQRWIRA